MTDDAPAAAAAGDGVTDPAALWRDALAMVLPVVDSPMQRRWLAGTEPVGYDAGTLVIASPHAFARDWLERAVGDPLRDALAEVAGGPIALVITVRTAPAEDDAAEPAPAAQDAASDLEDLVGHARAARAEVMAGALAEHDPLAALDHRTNPLYDVLPDPADAAQPTGDGPLEAPGRPAGPTVAHPEPPPARLRTEDLEPDTRLNPRYSFDDFVIGSSNRFAHAAAVAVSESPAKSYNPLFVYGGAGLGKTHLLHAIGHYAKKLYPRLLVRYVTTEQFTNEFINAIRDDRIGAFQRTYRMTDVLLVDDVQFLQSKERTQEEFFHTFNALHNAEKQIVLSSDRPPKAISALEERLRSRFEWGLMTDIQPPDLETRIAILRKKAESDRLGVPHEVLEVIATRVASNIRELEGALIRVSAFASLQRKSADTQMAEYVLKDLFPDGRDRIISVQDIIDEVAAYYSLTAEELCSASRSRQLVNARQIAMYLTRELTDLSLPRIGRAFGNRDHSTVMHATQKIAGLMTERRAVYDQVQELTNRVTSQSRTRR